MQVFGFFFFLRFFISFIGLVGLISFITLWLSVRDSKGQAVNLVPLIRCCNNFK
jgi:uncharacterized membrane protein (DUF485 family)